MKVINCRNLNDGLGHGLFLIATEGVEKESEKGKTVEVMEPVCVEYSHPEECVMLSSVRDANPFFHLMEAMWMLAGRQDVKFLSEFNSRMKEYSDDGVTFNAAYGYRLRVENNMEHQDQLEQVVDILVNSRNSRQAVCQIWDASDIDYITKDKACNMALVFRVRGASLDMTVYNRSNDIVWGLFGANAVHMSIIHQYVAACCGIPVGRYFQITNSFHAYTTGAGGELLAKLEKDYLPYDNEVVGDHYPDFIQMIPSEMEQFDLDLRNFFTLYDNAEDLRDFCSKIMEERDAFISDYFQHLIIPMLFTYANFKLFGKKDARHELITISSADWRKAASIWIENRNAPEEREGIV